MGCAVDADTPHLKAQAKRILPMNAAYLRYRRTKGCYELLTFDQKVQVMGPVTQGAISLSVKVKAQMAH